MMNLAKHNNLGYKYSKGLSLIEILVTVVVLSIGLLGIAGMQVFGMRYNNDSYVRSQAVSYANNLVERMRANPDAVNTGAYTTTVNAVACVIGNDPALAAPTCFGNATANFCTADEIAAHDAFRVKCGYSNGTVLHAGVINELPLGDISITCNDDPAVVDINPCTNDSSPTITVFWQNPDDKNNPDSTLQVQINAEFL